MYKDNNVYKGSDIISDSYLTKMNSYFNPYGYNLDSDSKNTFNSDLKAMKSKLHERRNTTKK